MRDVLVPDVVAGILVAIGFLAGLVIAWRRGFRAALPLRNDAFDFEPVRMQLAGSVWKPEPPVETTPLPERLPPSIRWEQGGSRLTGSSPQADGTNWRLEGVVHGFKLICLVRTTSGAQSHPEVWMLRGTPAGDRLCGYRIVWDETGTQLGLRELTLIPTRLPAVEVPAPAAASEGEPLPSVRTLA